MADMSISSSMTTSGEIPGFEREMPLMDHEIIEFRDEVLWPSIDFLARKDFVAGALVGSEFSCAQLIPGVTDTIAIGIDAYIWLDCDENISPEADPERFCNVKVTIAHQRQQLVDEMVCAAKAGRGDDYILSDEEEGTISAWEITDYFFSNDDEHLASKFQYHELHDSKGKVIWSDEDMCPEDSEFDDVDISEADYDILTELDEDLESINDADRQNIRLVLTELGVPLD